MGRKKLEINGNVVSGTIDDFKAAMDAAAEEQKPIEITSAVIKELLCNYGYEIKTGPGAGDKIPTRKGSAIVHEDMRQAFEALNVHLAILDDAFSEPEYSIGLDILSCKEAVENFYVCGFKLSGSEENEGIVLLGEKSVQHGSISLESPKITQSSSYPFYDELCDMIGDAKAEVFAYFNGKAAPKNEMPELGFPEDNNEFDNPVE